MNKAASLCAGLLGTLGVPLPACRLRGGRASPLGILPHPILCQLSRRQIQGGDKAPDLSQRFDRNYAPCASPAACGTKPLNPSLSSARFGISRNQARRSAANASFSPNHSADCHSISATGRSGPRTPT
jgi:hypothetical protein